MNRIKLATIVFLTAAALPAATAGTDTDDLEITASVENTCVITGGTLAFGTYDTIAGVAVDGSATISVECTAGATATITLGQGAHADTGSTDADPARRLNDGGTNFLAYELFLDAGRTSEWGNTEGTGKSYEAVSAEAVSQNVYGRLLANQDVPAGSYTDTVVATVTF